MQLVGILLQGISVVCDMLLKSDEMHQRAHFCFIQLFILSAILSTKLCPTNGSIITSVGYVFETFSPYSMIRFFEFSDKGWNITENCLKDMYNYLEGLRRGTVWAIKLYDATSYYSGGAFGSNSFRIHNPNLCRNLLHEYQQMQQTPWKILDLNESLVPFPVHIIMGHYLLEIAEGNLQKAEKIQQLICFPKSCEQKDLQQILEIYLFQSNQVVRNSTYLKHRVLYDNYNIYNDLDFYILVCIVLSSVFLFIGVYVLENYVSRIGSCTDKNEDKQSQTSVEDGYNRTPGIPVDHRNVPDYRPVTLIKKGVYFTNIRRTLQGRNLPKIVSAPKTIYIQEIIDALSIQNVIYNVFKNDSSEVVTMQTGLFILFSMLLSYVHVAIEVRFISSKPQQTAEDLVLSPQLANFLMDMYFFISGSRLAYKFFQTFPLEKLNVISQLMHILNLMLQKILSLTPSYTFALFTERLLSKYFYYNIALEIPSYDVNTCRNNVWSNLFFMDTFFPLAERCMPWSWFIALEVQFFIIACLVLLLAEIHPKYAVVIGTSLFIVSNLAAIFTEVQRRGHLMQIKSLDVEIMEFNLVYDNISFRISPYLLGICLGYVLYNNNSKIALNIFIFIGGWIVSLLLGSLIIFGHQLLLFRDNPLLRAIFLTMAHTIWPLILFWIVLASITQYGEVLTIFVGHKLSNTLALVSPISLLIGPIVIRLFIFSADIPINLSEEHIFPLGLGCLLVIYTCALVMFILFDGPLVALFDVIIKRR